MKPIRFKFNRHGLGDCVHMAHALQLYKRRGHELLLQVEPNKRWVWVAADIPHVLDGELPDYPFGYPSGFDDLSLPDCHKNKMAFGLQDSLLPSLEELGLTAETAWDELCRVRIDATAYISQEARDEAEKFLEGLPRPIVCLHSRGTNWHERKSLSTELAFDLIAKLLDQTTGSVVVLDFDRRSPMVGDSRCKGIKPEWGHIGVDRLCALYEQTDLLIGVDSGPFHVAAMVPGLKALGVFRSLRPCRVCLPNPNAAYLVSEVDEPHWTEREDRWNFLRYSGSEPTADDIAMAAVQILSGFSIKETQMKMRELAGRYLYKRIGYDERAISLHADGTITEADGSTCECEQKWFVRKSGQDKLVIVGKHGIICELDASNGVFRGRWLKFERMPIEMSFVPQQLASQPKISVIMNWDEKYNSIAEITADNRRDYAREWGYRYAESHYPGAWGKLRAILDEWPHADWIFWLDTDACITNKHKSLNDIISSNHDVIITCDRNGFSSGAMLFRTTDELKSIIEDIWNRREEFDWPNGLQEQNGLMWSLWKIASQVLVVPQRTMNSYPDVDLAEGSACWQQGDFVLHCAGIPMEKREQALREAKDNLPYMAMCQRG